MRTGRTVAARQVESVVAQLRAGVTPTGAFTPAPRRRRRPPPVTGGSCGGWQRAPVAEASGRTASRLEQDYLPHALQEEGAGEARYLRNSRRFLGTDIDPGGDVRVGLGPDRAS